MARSKIDRVNDFIARQVTESIDGCRLQAHTEGKHEEAALLEKWQQRVIQRSKACGTYQRLELEDIIKGHNRAWPES